MADFKNLFESVPDAYLVLEPATPYAVQACTDAYLQLTGLRREEVVGRSVLELFPDDPNAPGESVRNLRESLSLAVATGQKHEMAHQRFDFRSPAAVPATFEERFWGVCNVPLFAHDGTLECIVTRVEDITTLVSLQRAERARGEQNAELRTHADVAHHKHIETELRESEARYRMVVSNLKEHAIFILDEAGRVTHWNDGAERLLGYTEQEIVGRSFRIFFTPEDQTRGEPERELATAKANGMANDDRWHLRKDGSRFFVTGLMCTVKDAHGHRIGLAKIMRDVTERQAAAAEREHLLERERAARAEAERTSRLKDDFLATLSHELRTPLNAIVGWTQILKTGNLEPTDLDQGLEVIERNTRIQVTLIEDLLDMSRIISGKVRLQVQSVQIANVVNAAIDAVRTAAEAKQIRLGAVFHGVGAMVLGDPNRLQQIVWNLLSNAIKFTPREGRVQVSVSRDDNSVVISVSDNGVGIHADFLPHVFERFRQADASTTRQHSGLGLGLSIVKQLVELHGGQVAAESDGEGRGATLTVSIPLAAPRQAEPVQRSRPIPTPETALPAAVDLHGIKVLVVDDEPDSGGLVKRVLERYHAEVQTVSSMYEALDALAAFQPDVLLSDIGMPRHDGYELIRRVRSLPGGAGIPAAALTALARNEDRARALQAGFHAHVSKPVEPAELITVVSQLVGRRAM